MKKLTANDFISNSSGFPIKGGTWDFIQEAHQETTAAIVDGLLQGSTADTILYGCEYSDDGVNYTVTAGAIYHSGEVFLVDAVGSTALPTGSDLVIYKLVTTQFTDATADPVTYTDAVTYNVHDIRKIVIGTGTSGTSGYIGDFTDLETMATYSQTVGSYATAQVFRMNKNYTGSFNWGLGTEISFDFTNPAVGSTVKLADAISLGATFGLVLGATEHAIVYDAKAGTVTKFNNTTAQIIPATVATGYATVDIEYIGKRIGEYYLSVYVYYA